MPSPFTSRLRLHFTVSYGSPSSVESIASIVIESVTIVKIAPATSQKHQNMRPAGFRAESAMSPQNSPTLMPRPLPAPFPIAAASLPRTPPSAGGFGSWLGENPANS